ncbi:hypothetical protein HZB78_03590 [Candidatus Collierbacteria bacterium]|nr:hypothetical protein [Candidatus Collierbacteria bacterium]
MKKNIIVGILIAAISGVIASLTTLKISGVKWQKEQQANLDSSALPIIASEGGIDDSQEISTNLVQTRYVTGPGSDGYWALYCLYPKDEFGFSTRWAVLKAKGEGCPADYTSVQLWGKKN